MNVNCPTCGSTYSLDALLAFSEASKAFATAIELNSKLGKSLINYLGLWRSAHRTLKFEKVVKILSEITPDIEARQIKFDRKTYPAPESAWVWAIGIMIERRDRGDLTTPINTHNYLYKVISSYKPENVPVNLPPFKGGIEGGLASATKLVTEKSPLERAEERKQHERQKHEKPQISMSELVANASTQKQEVKSLNNVPTNHLFAYLAQNRRDGESTDDTYRRLKALEAIQPQAQPSDLRSDEAVPHKNPHSGETP